MERAVAPQSFRTFSLRACRARVVSSARLDKGGEEEGQEKRRDDPSVRHVPSAKIENLGARRGDKGNGCYSHQEGRREKGGGGGGRGALSEKIRNKKLGPRHTDRACLRRSGRMGLLLRARGEKRSRWFSLVLSSWEVGGRCSDSVGACPLPLGSEEDGAICPFPRPSPAPLAPTLRPRGPRCPSLPWRRACTQHAATGQWYEIAISHLRMHTQALSLSARVAVVDLPAAGTDSAAIRSRELVRGIKTRVKFWICKHTLARYQANITNRRDLFYLSYYMRYDTQDIIYDTRYA